MASLDLTRRFGSTRLRWNRWFHPTCGRGRRRHVLPWRRPIDRSQDLPDGFRRFGFRKENRSWCVPWKECCCYTVILTDQERVSNPIRQNLLEIIYSSNHRKFWRWEVRAHLESSWVERFGSTRPLSTARNQLPQLRHSRFRCTCGKVREWFWFPSLVLRWCCCESCFYYTSIGKVVKRNLL